MLPFAFAAAALAAPPPPPARPTPAEPREAGLVTLQVSGGKPLRLRGTLVAEANSWAPGTAAWHEVSAWRCEGREIAVAVRTLLKAEGSADVHRAEIFPSLGEAQAWLEEFDPIADLPVDLDASDRRVSAVDIALRAAALRGRADAVARQWRALLGEVLLRLDRAP